MTSPQKFRYRLDTNRYGVGRLVRWRSKMVAFAFLSAVLSGVGRFMGSSATALALGAFSAALVAILIGTRREGTEIEGLPLAGEFEPLLGGLNIRFGRGRSRLKAWHSFDTIAYDPHEGLLTLVPEFGFAISLTRSEVANLDRLAESIAHFAQVEFESANDEDARVADGSLAIGRG